MPASSTQEMRRILDLQSTQLSDITDALDEKNAGENVLLDGPPGTGKTTLARTMHAQKFNRVISTTVTVDTPAAEWRGFFIPRSTKTGTEMGWQDGIAVVAMGLVWDLNGNKRIDLPKQRLIINEVHKLGPDLAALCHAVCDDRQVAEIWLPNGEVVNAQPDFQVVATSNDPPEALDEPIQDRFGIQIRVSVPTEEAIEALPEDLQDWALKSAVLYDSEPQRYISYRKVAQFGRLRARGTQSYRAARMVFREKATDIIESAKLQGVRF